MSGRRMSRPGGGGLKTLCIKIGYSEPNRNESRERSPHLAESSLVFLIDLLPDSDCLTNLRVIRAQFWLAADNFSRTLSVVDTVLR